MRSIRILGGPEQHLLLVSLFDHNGVTTPDSAAADDRGINPNARQSLSERRYVYPVVLRSSTQNTRVCGQIGLRQSRHDATWAGNDDG